MARKSNTEILAKRRYTDTPQGRDVYNRQRLERGQMEDPQTMTSRAILCVIAAVFVFALVYGVWSGAASMREFGALNKLYKSEQAAFKAWQEANPNPVAVMGPDGVLIYEGDPPPELTIKEKPVRTITFGPRSMNHIFISLAAGFFTFAGMYKVMTKNLKAQNMMRDMTDVNMWDNDQHVALPEEIQAEYDWFPDVGAHSKVQVSSMLSHMMLQNKGLKTVKMAKRYKSDVKDERGVVIHFKGEIITDDNGEPVLVDKPIIDEAFGTALFEASEADPEVRKFYDVRKVPYNPDGKNRDKLSGYKTVADLINGDWYLPVYEPQRPAGAYIVDTAPVNTMILAITRAGKGQTYIEPVLDMWLREHRPNNIVVNDPKGELLVKFYVRGAMRGFEIVQLNLINSMKTNICNPLWLAASSAREGDFTKAAMYVENIAEVFFPVDGGDDPVWPNAANNAFKRSAYGLIDFYLEEEAAYRNECNRRIAAGEFIDPQTIETHIDELWGKVTLYNCYQLFVQLTSKKLPNPVVETAKKIKSGEFEKQAVELLSAEYGVGNFNEDMVAEKTEELQNEAAAEAEKKGFLWDGAQEADCMSLFFAATERLPRNSMRNLLINAHNALRAIAGAEKMLASVYGIAITAMSFFTDPTISALTSGRPSQQVDLGGFSFPRRMGVRFHPDYVTKYHYVGLQCRWSAYADKDFGQRLGKEFDHQDTVSREGWARYFFDGKFTKDRAYVKLELVNADTGALVHTYFFEFQKRYQTSLDGQTYMLDPVLKSKVVRDGVIHELLPDESGKFRAGLTRFGRRLLVPDVDDNEDAVFRKVTEQVPAITQSYVKYAEKPKMLFLVTPPHLMKYAKLLLIIIKQLVDLNFDRSYMTKSSQKPLYKTRYMLDELGNLQSEGHGIAGFETMLSIGLGQDQQFTLILQTLQQLKDVYGDSVDKIVQGNTSNIVFLKSTDDDMIRTLEGMSGKTHIATINGKTITRDIERLFFANEGKVGYNVTVQEVPVITYNDMAFIPARNSIVFRAGSTPIWNRNETILPMSWRLFKDTIEMPGRKFSLQTIPTMSSVLDFDLKNNQPDFEAMLRQRMEEAYTVDAVREDYMSAFGYTDADLTRMDIDVYSEDLMRLLRDTMKAKKAMMEEYAQAGDDGLSVDEDILEGLSENTEQLELNRQNAEKQADLSRGRYAGGRLSREQVLDPTASVTMAIQTAYAKTYPYFGRLGRDLRLEGERGRCLFRGDEELVHFSMEQYQALKEAAKEADSRIYEAGEPIGEADELFGGYTLHPGFYELLASMPNWASIAGGLFDRTVAKELDNAGSSDIADSDSDDSVDFEEDTDDE